MENPKMKKLDIMASTRSRSFSALIQFNESVILSDKFQEELKVGLSRDSYAHRERDLHRRSKSHTQSLLLPDRARNNDFSPIKSFGQFKFTLKERRFSFISDNYRVNESRPFSGLNRGRDSPNGKLSGQGRLSFVNGSIQLSANEPYLIDYSKVSGSTVSFQMDQFSNKKHKDSESNAIPFVPSSEYEGFNFDDLLN